MTETTEQTETVETVATEDDAEQTEDNTISVDCKICDGTGEVIEDGTAEECSVCQGSGKVWAYDESDHDIETERKNMNVMVKFETEDYVILTDELTLAHDILIGHQKSLKQYTSAAKAEREKVQLAEEVQSDIIDQLKKQRGEKSRPVIITKNYTTGRVTVTDEVTLETYEEREMEDQERNPQKELEIPMEPESEDASCPRCKDGFVAAKDGTKMTCSACGGTGIAQEAPEAPVEPEADDQPQWCDGDALRLGQ
jgi:DnaJ-class molecular chaperone